MTRKLIAVAQDGQVSWDNRMMTLFVTTYPLKIFTQSFRQWAVWGVVVHVISWSPISSPQSFITIYNLRPQWTWRNHTAIQGIEHHKNARDWGDGESQISFQLFVENIDWGRRNDWSRGLIPAFHNPHRKGRSSPYLDVRCRSALLGRVEREGEKTSSDVLEYGHKSSRTRRRRSFSSKGRNWRSVSSLVACPWIRFRW